MSAQRGPRQRPNLPENSRLSENVEEASQNALRMMKEAGYAIGDIVSVVVDPDLPFMGYTFLSGGRYTIVVSGTAVDSGMLEGLLVHEMSHIYRMQSSHPSHNADIINEGVGRVARRGFDKDYQLKILHDIVNSLEDLYADDVSFKVFGRSKLFPVETAGQFFLSWLTPEPVESGNTTRDGWVNASIMLRNSFAISNMARHGVPDVGDQGGRINAKFLSKLPVGASSTFEYFQKLMVGLKENVSKEDFKSILSEYLDRFVELAEGRESRALGSG